MEYRTDLAMERMVHPGCLGEGIVAETLHEGKSEITWVRVNTASAAKRIGKPIGTYWTMTHPELPYLMPPERIEIAKQVAQILRMMIPVKGDVLVLGLGNRRMTADALGDQVVSGILVTRHLQPEEHGLRNVCAISPGVLGVTGIETAELASGIVEHMHPAAVIVVDSLAAMETGHIGTTIQVTDAGIHPGSGVGNHRKGINKELLNVPVIALGIPMVVYASTIVRDTLQQIIAKDGEESDAQAMAEYLAGQAENDLVVTPRNIDELVADLSDMLALAINSALQPGFSIDELTHYLH